MVALKSQLSSRFSVTFRTQKSFRKTLFGSTEYKATQEETLKITKTDSSGSLGSKSSGSTSSKGQQSENWFFSDEFTNDIYCKKSSQCYRKNSMLSKVMHTFPETNESTLVVPLWVITVKGFSYQKLCVEDKEWICRLPEGAQRSVLNLFKQITIFDFENSEFVVKSNFGNKQASRRLTKAAATAKLFASSRQWQQDKSKSFRFVESVPSSPRLTFTNSRFSRSSRRFPISLLEAENGVLQQYGVKAMLCKHECHLPGGSIVLIYLLRIERKSSDDSSGSDAAESSVSEQSTDATKTQSEHSQ